jgi:hypothetical protein
MLISFLGNVQERPDLRAEVEKNIRFDLEEIEIDEPTIDTIWLAAKNGIDGFGLRVQAID